MAFCGQCGAQVEDGIKFCPQCGAVVDGSSNQQVSGAQDVEQNKVLAIIGYFGIFSLIPLCAAPNSKFAQFHSRQGFTMFCITFILNIASWILALIPFVGWICNILIWLADVAIFVLSIMGIVGAVKGEMKPLPIIGKYDAWNMITKK